MAVVTGEIRGPGRRLRGVLIEVFSVPIEFQNRLPLRSRDQVTDDRIQRLGSTLTDDRGHFQLEYGSTNGRGRWGFSNGHSTNLWLMASAYGPNHTLDIVYQDPGVRRKAGLTETYGIVLGNDDLSNGNGDDVTTPVTPAEVADNLEDESALGAVLQLQSKQVLVQRSQVRTDFRTVIAPKLRRELSSVVVDDQGAPIDPDFVSPSESVLSKAGQRMATAVNETFSSDASEPMLLAGRVLLTDAQLEQVIEAGRDRRDGDSVTVSEEVLNSILESEGNSGTNPETGQATVTRTEAILAYCREKTKGEHCLSGDSYPHDPDDDDPGQQEPYDDPIEPSLLSKPQPGDRRNRIGRGVALQTIDIDVPSYVAKVLDEVSVFDPDFDGLPSPGDQLQEDDVANRAAFPSLLLPPGPADVPAFHDFHELQIAFKPVWMEALDNTSIDDAEDAYERYVELGGDPDEAKNSNDWRSIAGLFNLVISVAHNPPPQNVVSQFEITGEEWTALPKGHRNKLEGLALGIVRDEAILRRSQIGDRDYRDGVDADDLKIFEQTHRYVGMKVARRRAEARRIIRFARTELERRAGATSPVPSHRIITALKSRALSQYPTTYFAATRKERSVNFGLLITYRQRWEPTAYQVGDLITSVPLAPKEVRKYSKKIVMKEKRSRKEVESNLENQRSETQSTSRSEAEIVQRALDKTNFTATSRGSFKIGIYDVSGSNALTEDAEKHSAETKKSFHEAVVKAAREYKNELKVEIETDSSTETELQESGEIVNPNDELPVTYLFYELQRRYRVNERLHRLTSVVLVAQEMPEPADIDEDWLIVHRWILNRVLLDDSFRQPLRYVAEGMVAEEHALHEMRKSLAQQRSLVDELKEDVAESRSLTETRYSSLQRSMERTARAQDDEDGGGLLGFAKNLNSLTAVHAFTGRLFGSDDEEPEAARVREAAARDAYERELHRLADLESRLGAANTSLARATEEYASRISTHLTNVVLVEELKNHIKDNALYYMQAIWLHVPEDQRWMELKDVPVPVLTRQARDLTIRTTPVTASLANVAHLDTKVYEFSTAAVVDPPNANGGFDTVPLYEVADLRELLGFKANYMIFAMKEPNALTDFMMEPFVERAAGGFGLTDPDDLGNMSLDDFSEYVCCLKRNLSEEEFARLREEVLLPQLKALLQSPLRDDEEIVVPLDALFIEALPGAKPILENFKLFHRQLDAASAQEELRLKKMEKIRYAQRILSGELDDPTVRGQYIFRGAIGGGVTTPTPDPGDSSNAS